MSTGDVTCTAMAGWMADGLVQAACLGTVATPAFLMQTGTGYVVCNVETDQAAFVARARYHAR